VAGEQGSDETGCNPRYATSVDWILLTYQLPSAESRPRVAVWREVRRSGALHLQQSVVAFPATEEFRQVVGRFRGLVAELGGETLVLEGQPSADADADHLRRAWNEARDEEYGELTAVCTKFLVEIEHEFEIEKFTLAELEEEESEFEKLRQWHQRIAARDVCEASKRDEAGEAMQQAAGAFERYSEAVYERTRP
jgi:hypothetical protein